MRSLILGFSQGLTDILFVSTATNVWVSHEVENIWVWKDWMEANAIRLLVAKFKGIGSKPMQFAFVLAVWLVVGGYFLTRLLVG